MQLLIEHDKHDKGTPIEMANAIIQAYMGRAEHFGTDDAMDESHANLAEIAEHIQTYVKYNRKSVIRFMEEMP